MSDDIGRRKRGPSGLCGTRQAADGDGGERLPVQGHHVNGHEVASVATPEAHHALDRRRAGSLVAQLVDPAADILRSDGFQSVEAVHKQANVLAHLVLRLGREVGDGRVPRIEVKRRRRAEAAGHLPELSRRQLPALLLDALCFVRQERLEQLDALCVAGSPLRVESITPYPRRLMIQGGARV